MSDYIKGEQSQIIAKAKAALIESTNIETSPKEMAVLDDMLMRCWQMGWLDKYEKDLVEVVRCKDCKKYMTIHCTCDGCCISDEWYCADGERKEQEHET